MKRLCFIVFGCSILALMTSASGCKDKKETTVPPAAPQEVKAQAEPAPQPQEKLTLPVPDPKPKNARVRVKTKFGDMVIRLYDETPGHRDNFLMLVENKFYDGLLFHRCIPKFMVQGGDPDSRGAAPARQLGGGGPGYTVPAEFNPNLIHKKGALSAARQGDQVNPQRASSGSQFYLVQGQPLNDMQISQTESYVAQKMPGFKYTEDQKKIYRTIGGTPQLDMDYTVYGEVIEGLSIIDSIAAQPTTRDRPLQDVIMNMEVIR